MDDPKTYRWQRWSICRTSSEWVNIYLADDPAIVAALSIANDAREAGLVDEHGNLRRIVGTLPMTQDGCVVGDGSRVYFQRPSFITGEMIVVGWDVSGAGDHIPVDTYWSTREAAERAAGGGDA